MEGFTYETQTYSWAWLAWLGIALAMAYLVFLFLKRWVRQKKSERLFLDNRTVPRLVQNLRGQDFEGWTEQLFLSLGLKARRVGGVNDHGVDVVAEYNGKKIGIQCKLYFGERYVGEHMVRDLYGVKTKENFYKVMLLTTGNFSPQAIAWARGAPGLVLVNALFLEKIILNRKLLLEAIK